MRGLGLGFMSGVLVCPSWGRGLVSGGGEFSSVVVIRIVVVGWEGVGVGVARGQPLLRWLRCTVDRFPLGVA